MQDSWKTWRRGGVLQCIDPSRFLGSTLVTLLAGSHSRLISSLVSLLFRIAPPPLVPTTLSHGLSWRFYVLTFTGRNILFFIFKQFL